MAKARQLTPYWGSQVFFQEGDTSHVVTTAYKSGSAEWGGQKITIVDTPGMRNPSMSPVEMYRVVDRLVELCPEGIHGFLHVKSITNPRFTEDDEQVTSLIENTFGENMANHTILVYTNVESKMHGDFCLKDFCDEQQSPGGLVEGFPGYMDKLSWRIFAIDNYSTDSADEEIYRRNLIAAANKMIMLNNPNPIFAKEAFNRALDAHIRSRCKNFPQRETDDEEYVKAIIRENPQITDEELQIKLWEWKRGTLLIKAGGVALAVVTWIIYSIVGGG